MKDEKDNRQKQINDIVCVVKIASILFLGISLCRRFSTGNSSMMPSYETFSKGILLLAPLIISVFIYFKWAFSAKNRIENNKKVAKKIEAIGFIVLFSIVIFICGANENTYKFIYLFIIITTTIQLGMKTGLIISFTSSIVVLGMDIIMSPNVQVNPYFEGDLILVAIFILTAWSLGFYVKIEGEHIRKLENLVNFDGLTDLYNHRYFCDTLTAKVKKSKCNNRPISMILMDIDYFKQYNDTYGHEKGDYVLKKVAEIIKVNIRKGDIAARYGGEEFAVILPNTNEIQALGVAEQLRKGIENTYFSGEETQPRGKITASIGVSIYPDKSKDDIELIKNTDDALYRAKFFYKNRVELYSSILDEIKSNIDEKDIELVTSIKTLISVINAKDRYTYGHIERVVVYSRMMADKLKLSEEDRRKLIYGAYMHDIGKINLSKKTLIKKMKLTDEEWEELKQHPVNGVEIIKSVQSLKKIIPLIISHHERYDGNGYPRNLKGEEIPYLARVLTVVDSFDAMTTNRPYNNIKTYEEGLDEIEKCSGKQFDPKIARAFIEVIKSQVGRSFLENINKNRQGNMSAM